MVTADNEQTTDIVTEGDVEETTRFCRVRIFVTKLRHFRASCCVVKRPFGFQRLLHVANFLPAHPASAADLHIQIGFLTCGRGHVAGAAPSRKGQGIRQGPSRAMNTKHWTVMVALDWVLVYLLNRFD